MAATLFKWIVLFRFSGLLRLGLLAILDLSLGLLLPFPPSLWALWTFALLSLRRQTHGAWDLRAVPKVFWIPGFIVYLWDKISSLFGHPFSRIIFCRRYWRWLLLLAASINVILLWETL